MWPDVDVKNINKRYECDILSHALGKWQTMDGLSIKLG